MSIDQPRIAAYRDPDRTGAREQMISVIDALTTDVPAPLVEFRMLGRTLARRAEDVLASFDRPGTSNWPTEGLGFRNLTH